MKFFLSKYVILFFLLFSFLCISEVKAQPGIEMQVTLSRFDKFHQIGYVHRFSAVEARAGFGYGIVKTAFQNRFFPQAYVGLSYDFLKNEKWMLGPTLYYSFSQYAYIKGVKGVHGGAKVAYHDLFFGPQFYFGGKLKVGMRTLIGPSWQMQNYNVKGDEPTKVDFTLNYSAEISVRYAF